MPAGLGPTSLKATTKRIGRSAHATRFPKSPEQKKGISSVVSNTEEGFEVEVTTTFTSTIGAWQ